MPCIAGQYDPAIGLLINVLIFPTGKKPVGHLHNPPIYKALIDTGASCTCIAQNVITQNSLVPHTKITMVSASGNHNANAYMFHVAIATISTGSIPPSGTVGGQLHTFNDPVQGMELLNPTGRFDVLLGMDILKQCSFKFEFDGHFSLCW